MPPRPGIAPLALTMGEPAGIGGEIALKAWQRRAEWTLPSFFVIDEPRRLEALAALLGWDLPIATIARPEEATTVFGGALPVLPIALPNPVMPGRPDPTNAPAVLGSIAQAVALARSGEAGAVVTNPIHKGVLLEAGFKHPGHTEYLGELCGGIDTVMMLASAELRVVPVTVHLSLKAAIAALTTERIVVTGQITADALKRQFAIPQPRLAVAALNPHAGEGGAMGREEIEVIAPAVAELRARGIDAAGPFPADTLFHDTARARADAVLCMYHDQALIPLKTLDFAGGVNVTLGLPIIRTSPDHGTAFDIAGQGRADPTSLLHALRLAGQLATHRA